MKVEVLGNAQDGGVPHLGCSCQNCEAVRNGNKEPLYVNSLLLKEDGSDNSVRYLIGATPDIRFQIVGKFIDGVFVSDSQMADMLGLLHFGKPVRDAKGVPVYSTPEVLEYLEENDPYKLLVDRENIEAHPVEPGEEVDVQGGKVTPVEVNHYGENRTLAFMIEGEGKKLFYMSQTDEWREDNLEKVKEADIAIIDGCFWTPDEIDRYEEVLHPPIKQSLDRLEDVDTEIYFTHFNHTNPVIREDSDERQELEERGFGVVEKGDEFEI